MFQMIRWEDNCLENLMLRLRHSSIQTPDQIYGHLRPPSSASATPFSHESATGCSLDRPEGVSLRQASA